MRDLLLLALIGSSLALALRYPFAGLLTWAWFTLMTPHQMAYGAFGLPLNAIIAGVTCFGFIASGALSKLRFDPITVWIALFAAWLTIAQAFSLDPAGSAPYHDRFIKTLLFVFLCAQMSTSRLRIHALVWMIVVSIGFFAAKGALFTLATFGEFRVQGLENTILEDNNHFGIAAASILPLILYLREQSARSIIRTGLTALFVLTIIAVIGTHSRGAFLCLAFFGGIFIIRSRHKAAIMAALVLVSAPTIAFMPGKWTERMSSIGSATQDASFMGRVDAWVINTKLANRYPMTGSGLRNSYNKEIAATVDPDRSERAKAAHSIYFEVLGGAGYIGLLLYLGMLGAAFFTLAHIQRIAKASGSITEWQTRFAFFAQISLVIFCLGGASTSMEMWDCYLIVIALCGAVMKTCPAPARPRIRISQRRLSNPVFDATTAV